MVALHHALEDDDQKELKKIKDLYRKGQLPLPNTPIIQNTSPKYYKGKSDSDAYYGYKLVNGQAGELKTLTNQVFYWCTTQFWSSQSSQISYTNSQNSKITQKFSVAVRWLL